jgi:hypothetical protein
VLAAPGCPYRVTLRDRNAARDRFADGGAAEIVNIHKVWLALRVPLASRVLEIADQLKALRPLHAAREHEPTFHEP